MKCLFAVPTLARVFILSVALCRVPGAAAQQLTAVSYTFDSLDGTPSQTADGVSASEFVRDSSTIIFYDGSAGNPAPDANSSGWTTDATLDPGLYYTFSVTGNTGGATWNMLALDLANFDSEGINDGPTSFAVRSSLDGFGADLFSGSVGAAFAHYDVPLGGDTGAPSEYRIYGFGAGTADGLLQVDNVALVSVPEPSATAALLAAGTLAGCLALRRRGRPDAPAAA